MKGQPCFSGFGLGADWSSDSSYDVLYDIIDIPCFPTSARNFKLSAFSVGSAKTLRTSSVATILIRALSVEAMNGNPGRIPEIANSLILPRSERVYFMKILKSIPGQIVNISQIKI
jgi:hypothetical protein